MAGFLDAALAYLDRGWSVVPAHSARGEGRCSCGQVECDSAGKHPRIAWREFQRRRPSAEEVTEWWRQWANANVGIVTGAISGIVVLDVDPRHGGADSLHDLGALPDTLTALTGGGGQHLYYRHPGYEVRPAAGLLPGIDVRGDGGYVIAPPSRHQSGRQYAWEVSSPEEPAALPEQITELLSRYPARVGEPGLPGSHGRAPDLAEIVERGIRRGERNNTLTRLAGHFLASGESEPDVLLKLDGINVRRCLTADGAAPDPLPYEDVARIVHSIAVREEGKRAARTALEARLEGSQNGELSENDRLRLLQEAWHKLGVDGVTRWRVQLGAVVRYILTAGEAEVTLPENIYSYQAVRARILGTLRAEVHVSAKEWPRWPKVLRDLAEEETYEPVLAEGRVGEWLTEFLSVRGDAVEALPETRRVALEQRAILVDGRVCLRPSVLVRFLEQRWGGRLAHGDVIRELRAAGWTPHTVRAGPTGHSTTSAWRAP